MVMGTLMCMGTLMVMATIMTIIITVTVAEAAAAADQTMTNYMPMFGQNYRILFHKQLKITVI